MTKKRGLHGKMLMGVLLFLILMSSFMGESIQVLLFGVVFAFFATHLST